MREGIIEEKGNNMDYNRYFTNEELEAALKEWAEKYPGIMELSTIGKSFENRPIWLAVLTNKATGPDIEKPGVWLDANIHATEIAGTTTTMYILENLLTSYNKDKRTTRILDSSVIYVVPRINPDGAKLAMDAKPRYVRSGVRYYPYNEKDEGLHEQDIDGDGRILQMRIPDPAGEWKISSLDPRLLEKRQPDEVEGQFYRLLPEGIIEDFDGDIIKLARTPEGLDFNRNFPFQWRPENEQDGAGPYPTSEPEIKAVADFFASHQNVNVGITFHTFSGAILRPYSTKPDDDMEVEDLWVYKKLGEIGTKHTGYRAVSTYHDFRYTPKEITTGAFDDWLYDQLGIFTFTVELWDLPTQAGIKDRKFMEWFREHPHEEDLMILKWAEENAGSEPYVAWKPFNHPQLGPVELGGWDDMYTWRNPPHAFMEKVAEKQLPFVLSLANMLPHLEIRKLEATSLGGGDYRICLVIQNNGFFPTFTSQQGKKRLAVRPVRAELVLPEGALLVNGKRKTELGHLEGRSNKLETSMIWGSSGTDNRARAEWIVHANPGDVVRVNVLSDRAGVLRKEVVLGQADFPEANDPRPQTPINE